MSQTNPAPYQPSSPPAVPDRTNRTGFAAQMYAFFQWLAGTTAGGLYYALVNLATITYNNAVDAFNNATAAAASASQANTYASNATNASNVFGTSTNVITPTLNSAQSITYATGGGAAQVGMRVRFASRANPATNFGSGTITANAAGTLTVNVDNIGTAPASASDWNIMLEGSPGVGAVLETAKVALAASGTVLVRGNAGAQVTAAQASTFSVDKSANLGNGWAVFGQRSSFTQTLSTSNGELIATGVGTSVSTVVIPAGVYWTLMCDGTGLTLSLFAPVNLTIGAPNTASVLTSTSNSGYGLDVCAMTTTRGFVTYWNGANTLIALIDNTGAVLGSSTLVAEQCLSVRMLPIDATRALVAFVGNSTQNPKIEIVSFTGTVVSTGATSTPATDTSDWIDIAILPTTSKAIVFWRGTTAGPKFMEYTIGAGLALTATNGTAYALGTDSTAGGRIMGVNTTVCVFKPASSNNVFYITEASGVLSASLAIVSGLPLGGTHEMAFVQTGRLLTVYAASQNSRALVSDFTTTSVAPNAGPAVPISDTATGTSGRINHRLVKVASDTYIRVALNGNSSLQLFAEVLTIRDLDVVDTPGAQSICNSAQNASGFGAALFGSTLVAVYADSVNSNFPTIRTLPLYGA